MSDIEVEIVEFPETHVAALRHHGPAYLVKNTIEKFIEWRIENNIGPGQGKTFALHYKDPKKLKSPQDFIMDISVSVESPIADNKWGLRNMTLPAGLCAKTSHKGQRDDIPEADYLANKWLQKSKYTLRQDCPFIFHYINIGPLEPGVPLFTDLYLPIK